MKLHVIIPSVGLPLPGIRPMQLTTFYPGDGPLKDWRAHVRGPAVFLESVPGWRQGQSPEGTTRTVYEIPRSLCYLGWHFEPGDVLEDAVRYTPTSLPEKADDIEIVVSDIVNAPGPMTPMTPEVVDSPSHVPVDPPAVAPADRAVEELDEDDTDDLPRTATPKKGRGR